MTNMHTETAMRNFLGEVVGEMETGGLVFTEDGEYVDAADLPLDPLRVWIDFEGGSGIKGRLSGLTEGDDDGLDGILDDEGDDEPVVQDTLTLSPEGNVNKYDDEEDADLSDELKKLLAEQRADDNIVVPSAVISTGVYPVRPDKRQITARKHRNTTNITHSRGEVVVIPAETVAVQHGRIFEAGGYNMRVGIVRDRITHDSHGKYGRK